MPYEQHREAGYAQDAETIFKAGLKANEALGGQIVTNTPAKFHLEVKMPKTIQGKVWGERTYITFEVRAQGEGRDEEEREAGHEPPGAPSRHRRDVGVLDAQGRCPGRGRIGQGAGEPRRHRPPEIRGQRPPALVAPGPAGGGGGRAG